MRNITCNETDIIKDIEGAKEYGSGFQEHRQSKGLIEMFSHAVLEKDMGLKNHLLKNIVGPSGKRIKPIMCAQFPGSDNECDIVGTFFIGTHKKGWDPTYPYTIKPEKIAQLKDFMTQSGARIGILAGETRNDGLLLRFYKRKGDDIQQKFSINARRHGKITTDDARELCNIIRNA